MIEKFTKEELEIIKRELKELPTAKSKRDTCKQDFNRLKKLWEKRPNYSGIKGTWWEMEEYIINIVDIILCNYKRRGKVHKHTGIFCRSTYVPNGMENEYIQTAKEIVDVVERHFVAKMKEEE